MMNDHTEYVLGFIFNGMRNQVCLLRKTHPKWQRGKLNGCGGVVEVEHDEAPLQAMIREAHEELGILPLRYANCWREFARLHGVTFLVHCYAMISDMAFDEAVTKTEEKLERWDIDQLMELRGYGEMISNLSWLIPLAIDRGYEESGPPLVIAGYGVEPAPVDDRATQQCTSHL